MKIRYWISGLLLAVATHAIADDISIGYPGYGGSGCPQGSVSATLSPDNKQLSLLFDEYVVESMGNKRIAHKTCNIAIPFHVPNGYSLSIIQVDYRGYNGLPSGANSRLTAEYFFAGVGGPKLSKVFRGSADSDYYQSHKLAASAVIWSPCGKDVNLRINSSMRVITNSLGEQAIATVDSIDLTSGMIYHFAFRQCR